MELKRFTESLNSVSALAIPSIVARVQPETSKGITDLLLRHFPRLNAGSLAKKSDRIILDSVGRNKRTYALPPTSRPSLLENHTYYLVNRRLVRYRNQPDKSPHQLRTAMHHHPQNQERASICQSLLCPDPVSFPVLSQIKPQAPLLVCPSVNSFKFQPCDHTPPGTQKL